MDWQKLVEALYCHVKNDRCLHGKMRIAEEPTEYHDGNMGAIIADTILQRGNDYKKIVLPAVEEVKKWNCCNMCAIWKEREKFIDFFCNRGRFRNVYPCTFKGILKTVPKDTATAKDVKEWMSPSYRWLSSAECQSPKNSEQLPACLLIKNVYGVGRKTADYFYQRCGGDILIPNMHVQDYFSRAFTLEGGCKFAKKDYLYQKAGTKVAKCLKISPRKLDSAIWHLMNP